MRSFREVQPNRVERSSLSQTLHFTRALTENLLSPFSQSPSLSYWPMINGWATFKMEVGPPLNLWGNNEVLPSLNNDAKEEGDCWPHTLKPLSTLCSLWRWQLWERLRRRCRCHNCGLRRCLSAHPLQGRVESRFQLILQYKERKKEMGVIFVTTHGFSSEPLKLPGCPREKLEENFSSVQK